MFQTFDAEIGSRLGTAIFDRFGNFMGHGSVWTKIAKTTPCKESGTRL
jgi:hypothetical protein